MNLSILGIPSFDVGISTSCMCYSQVCDFFFFLIFDGSKRDVDYCMTLLLLEHFLLPENTSGR